MDYLRSSHVLEGFLVVEVGSLSAPPHLSTLQMATSQQEAALGLFATKGLCVLLPPPSCRGGVHAA